MSITHVTDHSVQAVARLPEQYKGKPNMIALAQISGDRSQTLEDIFWDLLANGDITNGYGYLLDQIGDVVGQPREGLSDALYKIRLFAKVGENVSKGTPEDVIRIFKLLMGADRVYYRPDYPAGFALTAIGGTPIGTMDEIKAAMEASKIAGVSINLYSSVASISFSFSDDPDPSGSGFGDYYDASVGGTLATLL